MLTIYLWPFVGHLCFALNLSISPFTLFFVVDHQRSPRAKHKVPIAEPNVSPAGEESNVPSDEDDDEDSSEEHDSKTEEESEKSTGDVDPNEKESKVSDEEEVNDNDVAITSSTPLQRPASGDDYDTPIADLLGSNRSRQSKRKTKTKKHRKKTGHTGRGKTKKVKRKRSASIPVFLISNFL
jgi:hypothetical protein